VSLKTIVRSDWETTGRDTRSFAGIARGGGDKRSGGTPIRGSFGEDGCGGRIGAGGLGGGIGTGGAATGLGRGAACGISQGSVGFGFVGLPPPLGVPSTGVISGRNIIFLLKHQADL